MKENQMPGIRLYWVLREYTRLHILFQQGAQTDKLESHLWKAEISTDLILLLSRPRELCSSQRDITPQSMIPTDLNTHQERAKMSYPLPNFKSDLISILLTPTKSIDLSLLIFRSSLDLLLSRERRKDQADLRVLILRDKLLPHLLLLLPVKHLEDHLLRSIRTQDGIWLMKMRASLARLTEISLR